MTQNELSTALGITPTHLRRLLKGECSWRNFKKWPKMILLDSDITDLLAADASDKTISAYVIKKFELERYK